jgi:hypothetical protein
MFVASHKHEHLKGLIGQRGPLRLQDVLALVGGVCVMLPNQSSSGFSSKLVSLELAAATLSSSFLLLQLHGLINGTDAAQVI